MDRKEVRETQTWRQAHGEKHRHREQTLPHKAPESNPSQKTKEQEKTVRERKRQRQNQQQIKDKVKHQSTAGERGEIRATGSSTKKNTQLTKWINFQDRVDKTVVKEKISGSVSWNRICSTLYTPETQNAGLKVSTGSLTLFILRRWETFISDWLGGVCLNQMTWLFKLFSNTAQGLMNSREEQHTNSSTHSEGVPLCQISIQLSTYPVLGPDWYGILGQILILGSNKIQIATSPVLHMYNRDVTLSLILQCHDSTSTSVPSWTCDGIKRQVFLAKSVVVLFHPQWSRAEGTGNYRDHQPLRLFSYHALRTANNPNHGL